MQKSILKNIAENYIGNIPNWATLQSKYHYAIVENRWIIIDSFSYQFLCVIDSKNKKIFQTQICSSESDQYLDKLDELGFNTDFMDWFYNQELDNAYDDISEEEWNKVITE